MKKFQFRFSAVLKVKKILEDEALKALALQENRYQQELEKKMKLISKLNQAFERRENLGRDPIGISAFKIEQDCINGLKVRIHQADYAIFRAKKSVEKARAAFNAARAQSRIMETLHEKAYSEYKKEANRQEMKAQDELTLMRFRLQEDKL